MQDVLENTVQIKHLYDFDDFAAKVNRLGCNFALCDAWGNVIFVGSCGRFTSEQESISLAAYSALKNNFNYNDMLHDSRIDDRYIASILSIDGSRGEQVPAGVALVDLGEPCSPNENNSAALLSQVLSEMLLMLSSNFRIASSAKSQIETISSELSQVYEELVLLHKLGSNMKVTESDCNYLQMACDSLTEIVPVEGIAILLEKGKENHKQLVLAAGSGIIDITPHSAAILHGRLEEQVNKGKEALLDSCAYSPFKFQWPQNVKNILAVPLFGKDRIHPDESAAGFQTHNIIGLMVAVNRIDKPDFDSIDAKLFISVANSCAVFIENGRLFKDLKELFIGSLKALTSSIDAKDQYTRGHSDRVAFISKWIAENAAKELGLSQNQIHKIYLAGLLHDIGKMGIDESVLRKKEKLTEEEFSAIKNHPAIGAGILGSIKQMSDIVPGVLCHHERIDGHGYPNRLVDDEIPLIGKIVGLADSFDAMTSKRTYRNAMSIDKAVEEIHKGLGAQFDERIGRIFLNSDIYHLWDILQDGLWDAANNEDSEQYGSVAVGTLLV